MSNFPVLRARVLAPLWSALATVAFTPFTTGVQSIPNPRESVRVAALPAPPLPGAPDGVTAFVDVAVVPMDQERVLLDQTVLVKGGRITAMGPARKIRVPAKAVRIDGRGKFLLPGLADMHAHLFSGVHVASLPTGSGFDEVSAPLADSAQAEARLFLWLANGVTTVRNMDFYNKEFGRQALQFRARAAAGESWIPRIYTAGPWGPVQYIGVDSIDEIVGQRDSDNPPVLDSVARYIAAYKAAGYDFVKVHEEKPDILDSVLAAAKRVGIPVAGHVPPPVNVEHAISIGYTSIEHTLSDYLWNGRTRWNPRDSSGIRVLAAAMRRAGVWNCPTQSHYDRLHYNMLYSNYPQILKVLQDSGVKLLLGTDELPRLGVITRELQELVTGGLTPYQALLTGTRNPAVYFGTLDQSGTIAVGKRADLVLLTGNPLQDVHYTAQPAGVMLGGRWLPRAEIDRRVALLKLPTFVSGNDEAQYAPVKSYWQNVLDDEVAATASLLYDIAVDDSQRTKYQALQIAHKAQRQALVDSLGTSNQYAADAQRIFRLLAQQLGEDRLEVPLDERPTFDSTARVWMQRRKTEGHAVAIPGV